MFEIACGDVPQITYRRSPQPLLLSALLHATLVVALFAVHFSPTAPHVSAGRRHVVLIAPLLSPPPAIIRPRLTPLTRVLPHSFRAPPALPAPVPSKIALELPPALAIEAPRPLLATPELTRIPAAPAPPLRTDNLIATLPDVPSPSLPRPAPSPTGAFAIAAAAEPERRKPAVSKGGFSDASIAAPAPDPRATPARAPAAVSPLEILFKPHPLYTPEARRLKIEGEVLVELLFAASGEAHVLRVVRGLGHGLDENAIGAAQAIRFRPAQRDGVPIDSTAIVHIIFQLAF